MPGKKRPILLVEDNPDDVELMIDALAHNQITNPLVTATDGVAAIEYLDESQELPCLVLLDLRLPRMNGFAVLRHIRTSANTALLPVVVMTTSDDERDLLEAYRTGANSYVQKPVDFSEFHEVMRQLGTYWLTLNRQPGARSPR